MVKKLILFLKNQIKLRLLLLSFISAFLFFLFSLKNWLIVFFILFQFWFYLKHLPQIKKIFFSFWFFNLWFLFLIKNFNNYYLNYFIVFLYLFLYLIIAMFLNFQYKKESLNFLFLNDFLILIFFLSYFASQYFNNQFFLKEFKYLSQFFDFLKLSNKFLNYFLFIFVIFFFLKEFFNFFNLSGKKLILFSLIGSFLAFEILILINLISLDFLLISVFLFLFMIFFKNIYLKHYKGEIAFYSLFPLLFFIVLFLSFLGVFILI